MQTAPQFGRTLKEWRTARGLSQERLASQAEVSTRHLSFLETGRSAPSREMVLVLASALDLPLRERNALLAAAGFAALYAERPLEGPELSSVRRALDHLMRAHEPFGAVVVDRGWNVLRMNEGAGRILSWVLEGRTPSLATASNVVRVLFAEDGMRDSIVNFREVTAHLVERLRHESRASPHPAVDALLAEIEAHVDVRTLPPARDGLSLPFLPVHIRKGDTDVRLFTTLTTLGTPLDVTAQELRIESYFPADDATERFLRQLAGPPHSVAHAP